VNRVVEQNKEKVSNDYKILKHINCKGVRPNKMMVKTKATEQNELLKNLDLSKVDTKLQKEITELQAEQRAKEEQAKLIQQEKDGVMAESKPEEEELDEKSDDEKPEGIIQPKHKVVHSYPVDLQDTWEGHKSAAEGSKIEKLHILPSEITVTIYVKFIESLKAATLDINDSTLMFKYPDVYYLDINLMYKVDKLAGSAKFDKTKKTLTVRVPVTGSTEDSQKVLDKHFKDYRERAVQSTKDIKNLKKSTLDSLIETRSLRKKDKVFEEEQDNEAETKENVRDNKIADLVS